MFCHCNFDRNSGFWGLCNRIATAIRAALVTFVRNIKPWFLLKVMSMCLH